MQSKGNGNRETMSEEELEKDLIDSIENLYGEPIIEEL